MIMPTVTIWVTRVEAVTARLLYRRDSAVDLAESPTTASHRRCIRPSAWQALMVSRPLTISTSRAFFCMFCL